MITVNKIEHISFDQMFMYLSIGSKLIKVDIASVSPKLKNADDLQRSFYKISPSGYGIHWPLIDEDLSVDFLVKSSI